MCWSLWPILLIGLLMSCAPAHKEMRARSPAGSIHLPRRQPPTEQTRPGLPAHLVLEEKAFREPGGDGALDAGETGSLHLRIGNDGLGPARVSVRLTPLGPVEYLLFARYWAVGELLPGHSRSLEIPLKAGLDVAEGHRAVRVEVVDEYSRGSLPFTLRFATRALDPPEFRIVLRDYDDGRFFPGNRPDGRVAAGEMIKVTANIQNLGGAADGVAATVQIVGQDEQIAFTRDLEVSEGNPDNRFVLEHMATGEDRDVEFYFFTSPLFDRATVDLKVTVEEARRRFGAEEVLSLDVGRSVETGTVLAVRAVQEQRREEGPLVTAAGIDIEEVPRGSRTRREQGLAVIMAIERYKHAPAATWKLRDATTFFRYSRDVLGIPEERIMLRTDEDATKAEFDYIFDPKEGWLKKRLRDPEAAAEVDLFIYLAGHGFPDTRRPYLIPHDVRPEQATNGVSLHDLYQTLNDLRTRSVTIFIESCFSGVSGYHSGPPQQLAMNTNPVAPVMNRPLVGPAMVVYTATSGASVSSNRDDLKHGIFTYFVLKGLGGQADGDGDRAVTVEELYHYLAEEVPAKALEPPLDREQVPEIRPPVDRLGGRGRRILVQY